MRTLLVRVALTSSFALLLTICGCSGKSDEKPPTIADGLKAEEPDSGPQAYEASAEQLLAARLPEAEAAQGWIRLFDGHTLFGWEITGNANWHIEDGTIAVDKGEKCFLCTSTAWQDYELTLEFNADEKTNSGVFVRTPLEPEDPATDCYEINIAPDDNPFPTASIVKRQKVNDAAPSQTFGTWRRMNIRVDGNDVTVSLGDQVVCKYTDPVGLPPRRIALQHNSGRVAFRDIRIKPLGLESLLDAELSKWTKYPDMTGEFTVTENGSLHVKGGKTQLESQEPYDDFVLLAEYKMDESKMNSGIFFRCIPGDVMMGYECQVSNEMLDSNPLTPADCGAGGIFRRQDARIIAGEPGKWVSIVLLARGPQFAGWVNGVQVSDIHDDRKPHENPRKGLRLDAGTIMIQGHDETTDAFYRQLKIVPIAR